MEHYIARQSILSVDRKLAGFELLYRDNRENRFAGGFDGNSATRTVLSNALLTFDLDTLTKGRRAFVNFTKKLLMDDTPMLLDPSQFVIEILEDIEFDQPLTGKLEKYKEAGYTLALDDYVGTVIPEDVLRLLDIIKVDFMDTSIQQQQNIAVRFRGSRICLLAEKIESEEDFQRALSMGYELFQGYYFSRPMVAKKNASSIASSTYMKLAKEISNSDVDFGKLAQIIHPDAQASLFLARKMASARYYRGHTTSNITMALARMGIDEVRRWVLLLLLQNVLGEEMDELIRIGLVRAVFCEKLCEGMEEPLKSSAFGAGIFSVMATLKDDFFEMMAELPLNKEIEDALTGKNEISKAMELIYAYELADWSLVNQLTQENFPTLDSKILSTIYLSAVRYADETL